MEFLIDKDYFFKAISDVIRPITQNTYTPNVTDIKLEANKEGLILVGTNSNVIIQRIVPLGEENDIVLEIHQAGSVVLPAKFLSEMVKRFPQEIHVKVKQNYSVIIKSGDIVSKLNGFDPKEYPKLPEIDDSKFALIQSDDLTNVISQTSFATSKSEIKPTLTGVNMSFKEKNLECVATDSYRLALREQMIESNIIGTFIVPRTNLDGLSKVLKGHTEMVKISATNSYVVFKTSHISFFSRLIEGTFPSTSGMFSKDFNAIFTVCTEQFAEGVDRAAIFSKDIRNNNINLELQDGMKMKISSTSTEIGNIEEIISIKEVSGNTDFKITLDGSLLLDMLKVVKEDELSICFVESMKPVLIKPVGNPYYSYLIIPVVRN
ncbi:DNA polymerase III subunit beta [Peribacillus kribbensis]|uniref:DNA polymerase III subunit beta n=1 Tax=Peribacillus kribbensis TaxID=356658 RepID=UPI0003FA430A|nr:DNA polymerase III subunit beta [Peribacillus kribbensis]